MKNEKLYNTIGMIKLNYTYDERRALQILHRGKAEINC